MKQLISHTQPRGGEMPAYLPPAIEVLELTTENGFAMSDDPGTDYDSNDNGHY